MPFGSGEAFFIAETHEMRRQGCDMLIVPRSPKGSYDINKDADGLEQISLKKPIVDLEILLTAAGVGICHPIRCLRAFVKYFRSRNPLVFLKNIAVFPKSLWLAKIAKQWDVEHIHSQWALSTATMAMTASEITGIPWSCTAHRGDIAEDNLLPIKVKNASFFRFISESGVELARNRGVRTDAGGIHVLHMGVVLPPADQVRAPSQKASRLLCAANLLPVKGHRYLLEAMRLLKDRGAKCQLDIAGKGPLEDELQSIIKLLDIEDNVHLVGHIPHERLQKMFRDGEADVVILPSIDLGGGVHEGIPVVLMEAMSYGIPVLSTTTGGIPELLRDGAGIMVPPKAPAALADAIEKLLDDEALRKQLSKAGRRRVEEEFDVENVVARLLRLIEENIPTFTGDRIC